MCRSGQFTVIIHGYGTYDLQLLVTLNIRSTIDEFTQRTSEVTLLVVNSCFQEKTINISQKSIKLYTKPCSIFKLAMQQNSNYLCNPYVTILETIGQVSDSIQTHHLPVLGHFVNIWLNFIWLYIFDIVKDTSAMSLKWKSPWQKDW